MLVTLPWDSSLGFAGTALALPWDSSLGFAGTDVTPPWDSSLGFASLRMTKGRAVILSMGTARWADAAGRNRRWGRRWYCIEALGEEGRGSSGPSCPVLSMVSGVAVAALVTHSDPVWKSAV